MMKTLKNHDFDGFSSKYPRILPAAVAETMIMARKSALGPPDHQLLFILFYLKNYPTYDVLAYTFGISRGCACESIQRLLPILKQAQKNLRVLPKRTTDDPKERVST